MESPNSIHYSPFAKIVVEKGLEHEEPDPQRKVAELDKYIVGHADAKGAVAVAVRNRWRRQQLPEPMHQDVSPKYVLPFGCSVLSIQGLSRGLLVRNYTAFWASVGRGAEVVAA